MKGIVYICVGRRGRRHVRGPLLPPAVAWHIDKQACSLMMLAIEFGEDIKLVYDPQKIWEVNSG